VFVIPYIILTKSRDCSLLYKSRWKDHVLSTSQKAGLTGLYKKLLFMSTTAISKPVFQEVDSTVILPLTFIKELAFPVPSFTLIAKKTWINATAQMSVLYRNFLPHYGAITVPCKSPKSNLFYYNNIHSLFTTKDP